MKTADWNIGRLEAGLKDTSIAAVIPAYRVADQIERVISNMPAYIKFIIVVDDCSPDNSVARINPQLSDRVRLLRHRENQGVGGAMLTGYAAALRFGADIVVKMDGDDQMDPRQLPYLLAPILQGEADYTKGNRFIHSQALDSMPRIRCWGNLGLTFLTKMASGYWNIFDPTNGYTAIHSRTLSLINPESIAKRYFFEISLLLDLRRLNAVVQDVAMPARYGGEKSSLSLGRVLAHFPCRLAAGLFHRLGRQYFLYNFTAGSILLLLGMPLLLFGIIWGGLHWYWSALSHVPTPTGTILLSVLPIILGVQFLLQALALDIASVPTKTMHIIRNIQEFSQSYPPSMADYLKKHANQLISDECLSSSPRASVVQRDQNANS